MGSVQTAPASHSCYAARRATLQRAAPIPRACGSRAPQEEAYPLCLKSDVLGWSRDDLASVNQPAANRCVGVDAPVAQEWPVAPNLFERLQVDVSDQNLFAIVRALRQHASEWIAKERPAPKFQPLSRSRLAANVAGFKSYAIHHRDVDAIRNGMRALNGTPRVMLRHTELGLLRRM